MLNQIVHYQHKQNIENKHRVTIGGYNPAYWYFNS